MATQVPDQTPRNQYTATTGQTVFPYTFLTIASGDILVSKNGVAVAPAAYTVSGLGVLTGGNVTFLAGLLNGDVVTIQRDITFERTIDYQDSGDFLAATVDLDHNREWLALQQLKAQNDRVLQVSATDDLTSVTLPMEIPSKSDRRLKALGFDGSGNPIAIEPLSGGTSDANLINYLDMEGNAISVQEGITNVESYVRNRTIHTGTDSGVADAYIWTPDAGMPNTNAIATNNGFAFYLIPTNTNTGASTVTIKDYAGVTIGTYPIVADAAATAVTAGTLQANFIYTLFWVFGVCIIVSSSQAVSQTIGSQQVKTVNIQDASVTLAKQAAGTAGRVVSFDAGGLPAQSGQPYRQWRYLGNTAVVGTPNEVDFTGIPASATKLEIFYELTTSIDQYLYFRIGDAASFVTAGYNGRYYFNGASHAWWGTTISSITGGTAGYFARTYSGVTPAKGKLIIDLNSVNSTAYVEGIGTADSGGEDYMAECAGDVSYAGKVIDRIRMGVVNSAAADLTAGNIYVYAYCNEYV